MSDSPGEAAARAWLERLPAAERLAAHARTDLRLAVWIGAGALLIAACVAIARTDLVGRLRRAVEADGPKPWLAGAASAAAFAFVLANLKGAYDAFVAWPLEGSVAGGLVARLAQAASGVLPAVALAVLLVPPLQWLFRVRPRSGPLIAGLAAIGLCLAAGWGPYALATDSRLPPAPAGPVRDGLARLITVSGVPAQGVAFSPAPGFDADVTGGFGRAEVVVGREVLAWPPAEARAYVGHLMGHYAHADQFVLFLIYGLVTLVALVAIQALAAPLARRIGPGAAKTAAEPEALPAVAIILVLAVGAASLAANGYLHWANVRADDYSLSRAREPDGLAAVLERNWDRQSVNPNGVEEALFYSHPPLAKRLVHAMTWKADHPS